MSEPFDRKFPLEVCTGDACEFVGQVIDIFENFLDERKVTLRNGERDQSGENAAIIYGTDYGELQSELEAMFMSWGVFKPMERRY